MKFLYNLMILAIIGCVFGAAVIIGAVVIFGKDLPDYNQLAEYNPQIVTRLYSSDGRLLEEYATEHRLFVPINAVPKSLINAFLAAEDKNFYEHPGVDFSSIFRALIQNVINVSQHKSLVGGSTITQQVVKNFLLTNEKSIDRKVKEAILSFRISKIYNKDRILELYLNQIYLGNRSYGVASAALNYFNKSIDELTIEEAALLAAMPKGPSNYDPRKYYDRAKARRNWVIMRMLEENFITRGEAVEAMNVPINIKTRDKTEVVKADFFAETVRRDLANRYSSKILYGGGLVVRTTLDPQLQSIADIAFKRGLMSYDMRKGFRKPIAHFDTIQNYAKDLEVIADKLGDIDPLMPAIILGLEKDKAQVAVRGGVRSHIPFFEMAWAKTGIKAPSDILNVGDVVAVERIVNNKKVHYALRQVPEVSGGLIALEPSTGKVLALVGGFSYQESEFNRATQAKRQPGSVFKTFVYLSALENGFTPVSIINDAPIEMSQGPGLPIWRPKNYSGDFLGPTTLRRGIEKSRNTMTVRLGQMLGTKKIAEVTKRFGINDNPDKNFAIVLGSSETTLLRMTNAYAMIANGGKKIEPSLIERIQDRNGVTIYKRDNNICTGCNLDKSSEIFETVPPEIEDKRETILDPTIAYQMTNILEGVVQRGTAVRAKALGKHVAGKTGTTNDSLDTWFIGYTPDLVVGTYVGYDTPRSLGKKETGATVALPIFVNFMQEALKDRRDKDFKVPENIKFAPVDSITGEVLHGHEAGGNVIMEAFRIGSEPKVMFTPSEVDDSNNNESFDGVY